MNKVTLQAFSAGIIFSTAVFAGYYYTIGPAEETVPTIDQAKEVLNKKGYITSLPKDETLNSGKEEKRTDKKEEKQEQIPEKENSVVSYTIEVKANMTTLEISKKLEKEKIIDDATGFEAYVNEQGFSKNIQIGKFVVTDNMSYRQLAKTLTQ
ncbi:hypothetical protein ACQKL5_01830 [Peribacillus sp. NPDC097675]|uniref:hypothetical protein n=1 Tax=Peribacillus sp. NPDC097675 TaxID=3390618 RepID=UPI003D0031E5